MTAHSQRAHARLAPSASKRWAECPGSIKLSEGIPNSTSRFADEGTAAHTLADVCLDAGFDADRFADEFVNLDGKTAAMKVVPKSVNSRCHEIDAEMVDGVQTYLDYVREIMIAPEVEYEVEKLLDLSYLGIPGFDGGTGDFVAYHPTTKVLDVVDLKYGRGVPVEPKENTQGLCYALGAIRLYHNRGIEKLRITIVQPRCPHPAGPIRTWEADVIDLLDFEADIVAAAKKTHEAAVLFDMTPDDVWRRAFLHPGDHCKFCPAAPGCPARRDQAFAIAQAEFSPVDDSMTLPVVTQMTPEALGALLPKVDQLEDFCRRVKEYAHNEAVHGRCPPDHKLVAKRGTRRWKDEKEAAELLDFLGDQIFTEPKLLTPAKIEPMMPGKNKLERAAKLSTLTVKESSGTVLAPMADPRPAVKADASEFGEVMDA